MKESSYQTIIDLKSITSKRTKNDKLLNTHKFIMMSPQLALIIHFIQTLVSDDWKNRQSSASVIKTIFKLAMNNHLDFRFYTATYLNEESGY